MKSDWPVDSRLSGTHLLPLFLLSVCIIPVLIFQILRITLSHIVAILCSDMESKDFQTDTLHHNK